MRKYELLKDPLVNKRVEHIDRIRTAYIMWQDIPIATISEESSSLSGEFDWVIRPIWENFPKTEARGHTVNISGIDLSLHKDEYIRRYVPSFVTQRTIPDGREDLYERLESIGLTTNDLFEVMCRTHAPCGNNTYYVSRTPDKVVDVSQLRVPYDMPDFDTSAYGWLDKEGE